VFLQGEGVCDEDLAFIEDYLLTISIDIRPSSPFNPTFSGKGDIPLKIHVCKGSKNKIQVTGEGKLDLNYHAAGAGCTTDGTSPIGGIILPSGLGLGTVETVFIKLELPPFTHFFVQQCCEGDPGCNGIDISFPALPPIGTEIALTDGAIAEIPCSVPGLSCNVTFTMRVFD
jgi:hypothetical protein